MVTLSGTPASDPWPMYRCAGELDTVELEFGVLGERREASNPPRPERAFISTAAVLVRAGLVSEVERVE